MIDPNTAIVSLELMNGLTMKHKFKIKKTLNTKTLNSTNELSDSRVSLGQNLSVTNLASPIDCTAQTTQDFLIIIDYCFLISEYMIMIWLSKNWIGFFNNLLCWSEKSWTLWLRAINIKFNWNAERQIIWHSFYKVNH